MELKLSYNLLPHPYADEPSSKFELWGEFRLDVLSTNGELVKGVLDFQWDLLVFLSWFVENKDALLEQEIPLENECSSIAETQYKFYDGMDDDFNDDKLLDVVYQYRASHDIRFALRGTDIDAIYVGVFNGNETISFCDENEKWSYDINLAAFLEKAEQTYDHLIAIKMVNFLPREGGLLPE